MNTKGLITITTLALLGTGLTGCKTTAADNAQPNTKAATETCTDEVCTIAPAATENCDDGVCSSTPSASASLGRKPLWAESYLWRKAPDIEVQKWLTEQPELEGKFVMIEFWRTWCSSCKRQTLLMNQLQEQFKDDLVIIAITGQTEAEIAAYDGPTKDYYSAIDKPTNLPVPSPIVQEYQEGKSGEEEPDILHSKSTRIKQQGAYEAQFGVFGWPHVVLLEPSEHVVIWEGFPAAKGFELTAKKISQYIERGKPSAE